jgi:hypothetical protein
MQLRAVVLVALLASCGDDLPGAPPIRIHVGGELASLARELVDPIPYAGLSVEVSDDPAGAAAAGGGLRIALVADLDCRECYRIEAVGPRAFVVHGDAPLGVQYGLAQVLEGLGFRFASPFATRVPTAPAPGPALEAALGVTHEPAIGRRGIHLHTLHPIEGYAAMWEPGEGNLADARRIVDWVVKNRGDYLQWVALDDILSPERLEPWRAHTRAIVDYARARGLETGIAIQLFGRSNLQLGFDLIDDEAGDHRAQIEARFSHLTGLGFDVVNLSFGEFFGADPDTFIASVDLSYEVMTAAAPGTEVLATIHVGDSPEQRVDYMGENFIYYFLVKYADPRIVPLVHTVMFYDLFEDAGGAYHHEDFAEHREYLLERLAAGQRVGYFPETAYWVAFDNSVPLYLPLYVRSRWVDLDGIAAAATAGGFGNLDEHILFSSGWEWGYWQNDWAALRASYATPADWRTLLRELHAAWPGGDALADLAIELAEVQHRHLLEGRLMAYLAGRDLYIDAGDTAGIVSQPDRVTYADLAAMDAAGRDGFAAGVVAELATLVAELEPLAARAAPLTTDADRFVRELGDGVVVTALRARFALASYRAVLAHLAGDAAGRDAALAERDAALEAARPVVARRHADLHMPDPTDMVSFFENRTFYQFGYLEKADTLCYWEREVVEVANLVTGSSSPIPPCVM